MVLKRAAGGDVQVIVIRREGYSKAPLDLYAMNYYVCCIHTVTRYRQAPISKSHSVAHQILLDEPKEASLMGLPGDAMVPKF